MFTNIVDAIKWIETIKRKEQRKDLSRIRKVLEDFNNPHLSYENIHVGGTNGKGSVSAFLTAGLKSKYNVGTFISPYVVKFNERISVNGNYISDSELLHYANIMFDYCGKYNDENDDIIPFFEVVMVIAFCYFRDKKIDYAVIEVGLGGLLDATNVINAFCSIITNIGYDHVNSLGNTIEQIAAHKLGIVKQNNNLITTVDKSLHKMFIDHCNKKNAKIDIINIEDIEILKIDLVSTKFCYKDFEFEVPLVGIHQANNAVLAIKTLHDYFDFSYQEINENLSNTVWPGRFEVIKNLPITIIDGAHNIDGVKSLIRNVNLVLPNKKIHVCFTAMSDKDTSMMIELLTNIAYTISFTKFDYARVSEIKNLVSQTKFSKIYSFDNVEDCIANLNNICDLEDVILITGSLYFVGLVRNIYKK